jgi:dynactin complex subunit
MTIIEDIIARIEALEKRAPLPGPRGPAGPIDAAVTNAKSAMREELSEINARIEALRELENKLTEEIHSVLNRLHEELQNSNSELIKSLRENIKNEIAGVVLQLLQEYYIIDSEMRVLDANQKPTDKVANISKEEIPPQEI